MAEEKELGWEGEWEEPGEWGVRREWTSWSNDRREM